MYKTAHETIYSSQVHDTHTTQMRKLPGKSNAHACAMQTGHCISKAGLWNRPGSFHLWSPNKKNRFANYITKLTITIQAEGANGADGSDETIFSYISNKRKAGDANYNTTGAVKIGLYFHKK